MHLVVDFKVLLVQLNLGYSLRETANCLFTCLKISKPIKISVVFIPVLVVCLVSMSSSENTKLCDFTVVVVNRQMPRDRLKFGADGR